MEGLPTEDMGAPVALSLVGKLLTNDLFNVDAMKNFLKGAWKPRKGLVVRKRGGGGRNPICFSIFLINDHKFVLEDGSWGFDGRLEEVEFDTVQAIGKRFAKKWESSSTLMLQKCQRGQKRNLDREDACIITVRGQKKCIQYKYKRLPYYRFSCGLLGHWAMECVEYNETILEFEYPYGTWLCPSPLKGWNRGKQEE
ncbi:hypothetical protein Cgig2_009996 [Carnegiea gigantea]|uniref:Zinc knuckle CX2CX4HX4C domain-containing protein n=1 Tax=Carnegiea gigantea TaxID=171969 RepID=A0A9Q1JWJ6_9CARY|nr:hypothetical protein Cgig2_009996 [Carnegiea gigantea]